MPLRVISKPPRPRRASLGLAVGLAVAGCSGERPLQLGPDNGAQVGGDVVRIEGDDFTGHGPVSVYFGARAAKAVVIHSPWLITVMTPQQDQPAAGKEGDDERGSDAAKNDEAPTPVDVLLRFGDGSERTITAGFTYRDQVGIVLRPEIGS